MNRIIILLLTLIIFHFTSCENNSNKKQNINYSKIEIKRIVYLCKTWGALKYLTSNTKYNNIDWNTELYEQLSENPNFYSNNQILEKVLVNLISKADDGENKVEERACNFNLYWVNDTSIVNKSTTTKLLKIIKTNHGVINNPNLVYVNGVIDFTEENKKFLDEELPEINSKMVNIFRYWNIINYFFPYKNLMDRNWDEALNEYIPKILNSFSISEYQYNYLEFISLLRDGHGFSLCDYTKTWYDDFVPSFSLVNGKIIIENNQIQTLINGDSVIMINGKTIDSIQFYLTKIFPSSNISYTKKKLEKLIFDFDTTKILELEIIRNGSPKSIKISKIETFSNEKNSDYPPFKYYGNILYLNYGILNPVLLDSLLKSISKNEPEIIIDLRVYPKEYMFNEIFANLVVTSKPFVLLNLINPNCPGNFTNSEIYKTESLGAKLKLKKCILLVDENTMSHGEFSAMCFQTLPNTYTIGKQTAGADGDIVGVNISGGISTSFSGIEILYPDNTPTQRKGVKIDKYFDGNSDSTMIHAAINFIKHH
ncbi:MAG: hypothetical protein K9H61_08605 [Bacteroidia bacterium]|nr:hypothetical protein [Bacteroidia bacterium]MCF8447042.1 hypothetical protein [Bacteroidia bacterium]